MSAAQVTAAGRRPRHIHVSGALVQIVAALTIVALVITAGAVWHPTAPAADSNAPAADTLQYLPRPIRGEVGIGPGSYGPVITPLWQPVYRGPDWGEVMMRPGNAAPIIMPLRPTVTDPVPGEALMRPGNARPIMVPLAPAGSGRVPGEVGMGPGNAAPIIVPLQ